MRVILLKDGDPFANLAAERLLFEEGSAEESLLLYVNKPCVVIGRSQNPFAEADLRALRQYGMPLVRRYTGGGTVYHDPGNLNYTFIQNRHGYDKFENSGRILKALADLGIAAEVTERNDLVIGKRKFSGSAYRLTKEKALHHGTLLVSSDLSLLHSALKPSFRRIEGKGVLSVRSPVICLNDIIPGLTVELVIDALVRHFNHGVWEEVPPDGELYIRSRTQAENFSAWEWVFGRTPHFSFELFIEDRNMRVDVVNGRITKSSPPGIGELFGKKVDQLWNHEGLSVD
ncbi:lipoate--protein ligase [Marispirochaeta sp.]|jgi:lipoate---protein ligase|uniref:lipoate--protein ligase family protein n=1 Tax=Marispirochaeta sp. TaxID=2038653 RepID=UPI0029C7FC34|nr:lipoate--protein ligase [Marispirochaeta sp.]